MVKNPPANAGDVDSIPGSGRPLGEGKGNPPSILAWGIPRTRGARRAAVPGARESNTTDQLSTSQCMCVCVHIMEWGMHVVTSRSGVCM